MVDFSIFLKEQDKLTRVALIEFKALNPDKQSYMKDYVKLLNEDQKFVYFIMIVKSAMIEQSSLLLKNKSQL